MVDIEVVDELVDRSYVPEDISDDIREDTRYVGQDQPYDIGYQIPCPRCQSKNTIPSPVVHRGWWCITGCGLVYSAEEGHIFQDIATNDMEEY